MGPHDRFNAPGNIATRDRIATAGDAASALDRATDAFFDDGPLRRTDLSIIGKPANIVKGLWSILHLGEGVGALSDPTLSRGEKALGLLADVARLTVVIPIAAAMFGKPIMGAAEEVAQVRLSGDMLACRGGSCLADRFTKGAGVTLDGAGKLQGVSVQSGGATLQELTSSLPHKQVGVTTVGAVRAAGGDVVPTPTPGNPFHCTMCGITPRTAQQLFTPTVKNPNVP
jgi:hypothetical protein